MEAALVIFAVTALVVVMGVPIVDEWRKRTRDE
jgi:hypothetical protein